MKKLMALLLCLSMAFLMASCGGGEKDAHGATSAPETGQGTENASVEKEAEVLDGEKSAAESAELSQKAPDESTSVDLEREEQTQVTFTVETVEETVTAEDGGKLMSYSYQKPTVSMSDSAVQQTIQTALDEIVEQFLAYAEQMAEDAAEEYKDREDFTPYYDELRFAVARADEMVLSLVEDNSGFSGGVHGWDNRIGRNFDTRTGEVITFDQLGEGFRQRAEDLVLEQARQMEAQSLEQGEYGIFFNGYEDLIPYVVADGTELLADLQTKLYPDIYTGNDALETSEGNLSPTYYLGKEGVVFISGEYAMQPYAAGIIEFTVPYEEFAGVMEDAFVME